MYVRVENYVQKNCQAHNMLSNNKINKEMGTGLNTKRVNSEQFVTKSSKME